MSIEKYAFNNSWVLIGPEEPDVLPQLLSEAPKTIEKATWAEFPMLEKIIIVSEFAHKLG